MSKKPFIVKNGLSSNDTLVIGENGKLHANNTITAGTILGSMLEDSGTPTGVFGSASQVPVITVDSKGRITSIANTNVAGVTGFTYTAANNTLEITTADGGSFTATIDESEFSKFITVANTYANFVTNTAFQSALANTNAYIATKTDTSTFNSALANTNAYIATKTDTSTFNAALANTNAYISNVNNSKATWSALTSTNTAIRALVDDRMQVANVEAYLANTNAYIATKLAGTASVTLTGDVTGSGSFSSDAVSISTTIQPNSVALGTDTTGNYVATISGTTNEIEVSGSGSESAAVTIGLPNNVTISNSLTVGGSLQVDGDLTVTGNTISVSTQNLSIDDNMFYLNANSNNTNVDLGWAGNYNAGSYAHAGFFRDATDGIFKVYDSYTPEPDAAVDIDTGHASFTLSQIQANTFIGALSGNASTSTKLATARTISLSGDVTGSTSFDGSTNVSISATVADDSHTHDGRYYTETEADNRFVNVTGDTMTGTLTFGSGSGLDTATNDIYANMRVIRNGNASAPHLYIGYSNAGSGNTRIHGGGSSTPSLIAYTDYAEGTASLRAPIFYDSDNTAYYVDPNSYSKITTLGVGGSAIDSSTVLSVSGTSHFPNDIYTGGTAGTLNSWGARWWTSSGQMYWGSNGANFTNYGYGTQITTLNIATSGSVTAYADFRAPIFYDSDNTGYYVNPRSTSILSGLRLNGIDNNASGGDYILWVNKPNNNDWAISVTGQYDYNYMYDGAASHTYGVRGLAAGTQYWRVGTDLLYHNTSIQSPIFYDYNDTGYYLDAASTSNLNTLNVATINRNPVVTLSGDVTGSATMTNLASINITTAVGNDSHTHSIDTITDEHRIFNNMGDNHSTRTSFDAQGGALSANYGWRYVQGSTNSPGVNGATQYYALNVGLGNDYAYNNYGMQIAYPRNVTNPYVSIRYEEAGVLSAWQKISAGKADTWTTARTNTVTLTGDVTGTGNASVDGSGNWTVSFATTANYIDNREYLNIDSGNAIAQDSYQYNGGGYVTGVSLFGQTDGAMHSAAYSTSWVHQIYGDFRTGQIAVRGKNSGTWQAWRTILDSSNYTSYAASASHAHTFDSLTSKTGGTGTYQTSGDFRAPIFYDSNDTGYYTNPNSISSMYGVAIRGDASSTDSGNQIFFWGSGDSTTSAIGFKSNGGEFSNPTGNGDGYNTYLTMDTDGRGWVFRRGTGGSDFTSAYTSGWILNNGVWQANSSLRAPIFYDSNDTNWYVDPNGNSRVAQLGVGSNNTSYTFYNNGTSYLNGAVTIDDTAAFTAGNQLQFYTSSGNLRGYINASDTDDNHFQIATSGGEDIVFKDAGLSGTRNFVIRANNTGSEAYGSMRSPIFYDSVDTGYHVDPNSYSRIRQLTLTQARVDSSKYPVGHYTSGIEVFSIDPTWTQDQLREYFNSNSVSWVADSTAPGGYAIQITGNVNVGGNSYGSGFPFIPVDTDDTFYMECWIKDVSGTNGHYMGSIDFNENFSNLGGNPGSFGYWVMSSTFPGSSWTRVSGYISGFGTSTGEFKSGTKYWTPQALFNYSGGGTSYISGWKVYRLARGIVGRFPQSTINTGEAWYGRANDRNRGTFTVQLGGNSSSSRSFEVVDYAWSKVMFAVNSEDYATANGSFRAPIFYDSNDTNYYINPNSASVVNDFRVSNGNIQFVQGNTGQNLKLRALAGSTDVGISFYDANDRWTMQLYSNYGSGEYGFLNGNWASWDLRKITNGNLYMNNNNSYYLRTDSDSFMYRVYGAADVRSPIFYDYNNTAYYVDPDGYSNVWRLNVNGNFGSDTSGSAIYIGGQNVSTSNALWINFHSDGDAAYRIGKPAGAWTQPLEIRFYTGIKHRAHSAYGGHRFINYSSDSTRFSVADGDDNVRSIGTFYAPIMYDYDNTGYYCDPASTTNLNVVAAAGRFYTGYDSGLTNSMSCSNWFRSNGSTGWFNASYGGGIYMEDGTWVRVYNSKAFYVDNSIAATGNVTAYYSDERLKTKTGYITDALDKVSRLSGFYYVENELAKSFGYNNDKQQIALSAQEVQRVVPEAVHLAPFDIDTDEYTGEISSKSGENYLTVDYSRLVPLLVEAIKEQKTAIESKDAEIAEMKSMLLELTSKVNSLLS